MLTGFLIPMLTIGAAGFALRLYMSRASENRLRPGEDVAIADLHGALPPNAFVACPPGYCAAVDAAPSPVFAIGADRLYRSWERLVAQEPRVATMLADPKGRRIIVIQRSPVLHFPDVVTAEFVTLGPDRSSPAIYSRARYGRYDFGVNRRRVEAWLARLQRLANE